MHQSLLVTLGLIGTITTTLAVYPLRAAARPNPDRRGICYFLRGEKPEMTEPCVISTGYGAGAHYVVLQWRDGVKTSINMIHFCPKQALSADGFCRYTVDDYEAIPYARDVFLQPTSAAAAENLPCFKVRQTQNSVCYRLESIEPNIEYIWTPRFPYN